jgi:cell wall-associated NlpC family hydrolase
MNVEIDQLKPGVFGVCHGGGVAADLVCMATQSSVGHAVLYLGDGKAVQGVSPKADVMPADHWPDMRWAWRMWDALVDSGWTPAQVLAAQKAVVARGTAEIGTPYDWAAYAGFAAEILDLRNETQLAPEFKQDDWRVCSALVADALTAGGVPLKFVPGDGPGLVRDPDTKVAMPVNLVAPGMLLGLGLRLNWF